MEQAYCEVELPCGALRGTEIARRVKMRATDGYDEDLLRDTKEILKGGVLTQVVRRCIVDFGGATTQAEIENVFDSSLLFADFTFLLVQLRRFSVGDIYSFNAQCPACSTVGRYKTDLSELVVTEQKEEYRGVTELETQVPGVGLVTCRQLLVADQAKLDALKGYPSEKATRELMLQVKKIDGKAVDGPTLKRMTSKQRNALREALDGLCGGIDMELEISCGACGNGYVQGLAVQLKDFFFPGAVTSAVRTAKPFRSSGPTLPSSEPDGTGPLTT